MNNVIKIMLISASPVLELRGAIPFALSLGFTPQKSFLISLIGNLLPVPFLLLVFSPISERIRNIAVFKKFFSWLEERTRKKARLVEKYEFLGLILFVAIPLPTTGAWTGSFAASIFRIRFRLALLAIIIGVIIAGLIVTFLSWGGFLFLK